MNENKKRAGHRAVVGRERGATAMGLVYPMACSCGRQYPPHVGNVASARKAIRKWQKRHVAHLD